MKITLFSILLLGALASAPLRADEPVASTVKFSHPDQPQTVRIYVAHGALKIQGTDSKDTVTVNTDVESETKQSHRPDGLRVIESSTSFSLTEKDNVVELNYGHNSIPTRGADFTVNVPRTASIEVGNGFGAEISIIGVMGNIDIKNMNGEITLTDIGGGALVETMNGEIHASFASLPIGKALSFTSMNGEIEVHLPGDAKANVRFRTQNGSILTDFAEDVLKTKSESDSSPLSTREETARIASQAAREAARIGAEVARQVHEAIREVGDEMQNSTTPRAPRPPRPPRSPSIPSMVGGKVVSGTLNGGGVDLQIATVNGDIIVRKNARRN